MDSLDLLARENEFKKLNKQLEKKTESLMKEIENSMQKKDIFADFSCNLTLSPKYNQKKKHFCESPKPQKESPRPKPCNPSKKQNSNPNSKKLFLSSEYDTEAHSEVPVNDNRLCHCCVLSPEKNNEESEFLYAFASVSVEENILPQSFLKGKEKVTAERICKFFSAKIKLLQEQVHELQATVDKKVKQCGSHMKNLAELESQRLGLLSQARDAKAEAAGARAQCAALQSKLNDRERQYREQRGAADRLATELQQLRARSGGLEARCAAQGSAAAGLQQQLDAARLAEKEFKSSSRAVSASHQAAISKLEQRVRELSGAAQRQSCLTQNLHKQNCLLLADGALKALEKDYCDLLSKDF